MSPEPDTGLQPGLPAGKERRACLRVAGLDIALDCEEADLELERMGLPEAFLSKTERAHVVVSAGRTDRIDEPHGNQVFDSGGLWRLYLEDRFYSFYFSSPALGTTPYRKATFTRDFRSGQIWLDRKAFPPGRVARPLEYPLDELLVVNLLAQGRGVEIHGCGIVDEDGAGYLFAGQSGAGKSTIARLWRERKDVQVLSDDRIILRRQDGRLLMYGTPWHGEARLASAASAEIVGVYLLEHGTRNRLCEMTPARAVARLLSCAFVPFHEREGLDYTLAFLDGVVGQVPCRAFQFVPDESAIELVRKG